MSNLSLERFLFDPSDAAEGPNIGSYLRSSDGTLLTHTTAGSKEALDVNIAAADIDLQVDLDLSSLTADDAADDENPLKIGYRAHDTASALGAVSADGDKANAISDLYRRIMINDAPNVSSANVSVSVDTTAGGVALPIMAGRTRVMVQNQGDKSVYIGTGTVSSANGVEIRKGATMSLECGEAIALKAIAASGTQDVRVFELG
jgi:hypothetical protein